MVLINNSSPVQHALEASNAYPTNPLKRVRAAIGQEQLPTELVSLICAYAPEHSIVAESIKYHGNPSISLAKLGNEILPHHLVQVRESSPDVECLDLSGCRLTAGLVAEIAKLKNLKCLILNKLNPQEVLEDGIKHLKQLGVLPHLERLDLRDFPSTWHGAIFSCDRLYEEGAIGQIRSLKTLNIGFGFAPPGVRDIVATIRRHLPTLETLGIEHAYIAGRAICVGEYLTWEGLLGKVARGLKVGFW